MKFVNIALLLVLSCFNVYATEIETPRPDGSVIKTTLFQPSNSQKVPVVIYIDGSTCTPSLASSDGQWLLKQQIAFNSFGLMVVEKPGLTYSPGTSYYVDEKSRCPDDFKTYYAIDQRVLDILAAISDLRIKSPDWWDGNISIWGFSDGAHVAAQLVGISDRVNSVALISGAGAIPMRIWLRDMMCPPNTAPECKTAYNEQVDKILLNPTPRESWLGDANTYKAWNSRLNITELSSLQRTRASVLIIHGKKDSAVSPESADELARAFETHKARFTYRSIAEMKHGISSLPDSDAQVLRTQTLHWLLSH